MTNTCGWTGCWMLDGTGCFLQTLSVCKKPPVASIRLHDAPRQWRLHPVHGEILRTELSETKCNKRSSKNVDDDAVIVTHTGEAPQKRLWISEELIPSHRHQAAVCSYTGNSKALVHITPNSNNPPSLLHNKTIYSHVLVLLCAACIGGHHTSFYSKSGNLTN